MSASVAFRDVTVNAPGGVPILRGITLDIAAGETVAFIGRSGAGKTTTLRLVNGLAAPSAGEVRVNGESLTAVDLVALRRRIGYIIQGAGLFPHRSVYDNVATVPRILRWNEERIRDAARPLLDSLGLQFEVFASRFPRSLSGGEQQRVGIARALIADPEILLCDEPFGALDPIVRGELQDAFRSVRTGATILFVTHDLR
ncbi:MAG TPA: ATP-binding cassette domain-containing protein, partial [Thermoanaerobaculia bacterium]|nr:ATP-binding cassette domain-containing protein [Thermoanaerobaculia bacterium]